MIKSTALPFILYISVYFLFKETLDCVGIKKHIAFNKDNANYSSLI